MFDTLLSNLDFFFQGLRQHIQGQCVLRVAHRMQRALPWTGQAQS
jgi:hypothetical protein